MTLDILMMWLVRFIHRNWYRACINSLGIQSRSTVMSRHSVFTKFFWAHSFSYNSDPCGDKHADNYWIWKSRHEHDSGGSIFADICAGHKPSKQNQHYWLNPRHNDRIFINSLYIIHMLQQNFRIFKRGFFKTFDSKQIKVRNDRSEDSNVRKSYGDFNGKKKTTKNSEQNSCSQSYNPSCCSKQKKRFRIIEESFIRVHLNPCSLFSLIIPQISRKTKLNQE